MKSFPFLPFLNSILFFILTLPASAANYTLEMPLVSSQESVSSLSQYIKMLFMFGLSLVGIVALFAVVFGGINYLVSGSSQNRKLEGKRWIYAAISGIILLLFSYLIFLTLNPELVSLKEPSLEQSSQIGTQNSPFQLEMPLGNNQSPQNPGEYVKTFFIFGLGLVGIVALFGIIFGGVQYLLSAGNAALKTYGRQWITAALSGLVLLLCSYLILATINPSLVNLSLPPLGSSPAPATSPTGSFQLEMPLSGAGQSTSGIAQYIKSFFIFALGLVGVTALFAIIFGGMNYIFAGSSSARATEGKRWLGAATAGLAILLLSFLILNTINPELISLKEPDLSKQAQTGTSASPFQLEMPFSGGQQTNHSPGDYIKSFFIYGLGIVGIAALFAIIFGGMNYIFAGSSQTRATEGKHWIFSAISGIALLLCSYLILFTINPDLIALKDPTMATITIPPHTGLNYENFTSFKDMPAAKNNIAIFQDPVIMKALQDATSYYKNVPLEIAMFVAGIEHDPKNPYSGTSSKGARGVMQLMPGTATWLGVKNTNDPEQNIWGGVKYLSKLYEQFGNWPDALAGYNAGPNRVIKYGNGWNIPFTETQKYLQAARGKGLI